jgi:hypothetical protein
VPVSGHYSPPTTPINVDPLWEGKFVMTITGRGIPETVVVKPTDTVQSVLDRLEKKVGGYDIGRFCLIYKGRELDPDAALVEYGISRTGYSPVLMLSKNKTPPRA